MLCQSCGASSTNDQVCDYCGVKIVLKEISKVLRTEDSKRAKTLGLEEVLSFIYDDEENTDQVFQRLIERTEGFIEDLELKKAEFLAKLALEESNQNDKALLLSAQVKTLYGEKLSGSIQAANIKQKYIKDAREILSKITSGNLEEQVNSLKAKLDAIEGLKAGHYTEIIADEEGNLKSVSSADEGVAGCATIAGWLIGGLVVLGYMITIFDTY
tara:strand:- start:1268 stop:1909 length:642 start_codon:yes stop_codon:yes gene_type:complete